MGKNDIDVVSAQTFFIPYIKEENMYHFISIYAYPITPKYARRTIKEIIHRKEKEIIPSTDYDDLTKENLFDRLISRIENQRIRWNFSPEERFAWDVKKFEKKGDFYFCSIDVYVNDTKEYETEVYYFPDVCQFVIKENHEFRGVMFMVALGDFFEKIHERCYVEEYSTYRDATRQWYRTWKHIDRVNILSKNGRYDITENIDIRDDDPYAINDIEGQVNEDLYLRIKDDNKIIVNHGEYVTPERMREIVDEFVKTTRRCFCADSPIW